LAFRFFLPAFSFRESTAKVLKSDGQAFDLEFPLQAGRPRFRNDVRARARVERCATLCVHWRTAARAPLQQFSAPRFGRFLALRGACLQLNQVTIALRSFSLLDFMNHVDESAHGGALEPMSLADLSDRGDLKSTSV